VEGASDQFQEMGLGLTCEFHFTFGKGPVSRKKGLGILTLKYYVDVTVQLCGVVDVLVVVVLCGVVPALGARATVAKALPRT
jgi:hypothetical protein